VSGSESSSFRRRAILFLAVLLALSTAMTVILARSWIAAEEVSLPPEIASLPAFELTNRDGSTVSREDLLGELWVADFIFTRCGGICPRMTERMMRLESEVGGVPLRRVSITVDPAWDTPEVLAGYAESFSIRDDRWLFLTGPRDELYELIVEGFKLAVEDSPPPEAQHPDEPILHSNRFVLVDPRGTIRGYYDPFRPEALQRLLAEAALISAQ